MEEILLQTEPVAEMRPQSSEEFAGLAREKSQSSLPLPDAVGVLLHGSSVQHVAAQLMVQYLLKFGFVAGC